MEIDAVITGNDLRVARKRAGATLGWLASMAGVSRSHLSRVERGERDVTPSLIHEYERALAELGTVGAATDSSVETDIVENADRKECLRGSVQIGARVMPETLASSVPASEVADTARLYKVRQAAHSISRITAALFHFDRPDSTTSCGIDALTEQAHMAWTLRQRTDYRALTELLTRSLIETSMAVTHASNEQERMRAVAPYVHVHNAASSLLKSLNAPELGAIAADRALRASLIIEDDLLIAAATLRLVNVFLTADRLPETLEMVADRTDRLLGRMADGPAYAAIWGALLLTGSVAAAKLGEGAQAWEMLGQAKVAGAMLGREHADLYAIFGMMNLEIHSVQVATELGDPREALRRAERVKVDQLPPMLLERRTTLLIDIARCHAMLGDHGQACEGLMAAEDVAPQEVIHAPHVRDLVGWLLHTPGGQDDRLRMLADRLEASP